MSFEELDLHPHLLKAIEEAGYTEPTAVQLKAIPKIMHGFDIRGSAQTGSGKTAAFLLPALHRLTQPPKPGKGPRLLVLVPTRELAIQIASQAEKYSRYLNRMRTVCVYGGTPIRFQLRDLSRPVEILIATPGRLIDCMERGKIDFSRLEMVVLDEADRMLDMGFIAPVEQIMEATPSERQTLLFSATLRGQVLKLSERLLTKPLEIVVHADKAQHDGIEQKLHYVDNIAHKNRLLDHLLQSEGVNQAIVFTATKRDADQVAQGLRDQGHQAAALHGDMNQQHRARTLAKLKQGALKIVVATDVAARGIDVQSISHVINFDLPRHVEDYVHRIGRTGRAGAKGTALSFAAGRDAGLVKKIERYTGQQMAVSQVAGYEPRQCVKKNQPRIKARTHRMAKTTATKRR